MTSKKLPTEAELAILQVLWTNGPSSVREVLLHLSESRDIGYTTVLKLMQIMDQKELLTKDNTVRPQLYRPSQPRRETQKGLVRRLIDGAFEGSAGKLALNALSTRKIDPEERRRIRAILDEMEGDE